MNKEQKLLEVSNNNDVLLMLTNVLYNPPADWLQIHESIVGILLRDIETLASITGVEPLLLQQDITGRDLKTRGVELVKLRHSLLQEAVNDREV